MAKTNMTGGGGGPATQIIETGGPTTLTIGAVADGQALVRSGATVVGGSAGGYQTYLDLNLKTLTPGNIVDGANANLGGSGKTVTGENTAGASQLKLVAGAGARFTPTGGQGQYYAGRRDGQGFRTDVAQHVPGYALNWPLRFWTLIAAANFQGVNSDFFRQAIESRFSAANTDNTAYAAVPTLNGTRALIAQGWVNGAANGGTQIGTAADDVFVIELPGGILCPEFRVLSGVSVAGAWPATSALKCGVMGLLYTAISAMAGITAASPNLVIQATFASGGAQLVVDIGNIRLDAIPR